MSIIVQKYGGVCLETPEKVKAVAQSVAALYEAGHQVVVVVSAMGKSTDNLIQLAYQVSDSPNRRELDMLLTTGERVSMSLMGMALNDLGVPAISFTGSQAGVMTDDSHSNARIHDVKPIRVAEELGKRKVIVLAGFQGVHPQTKEITTLGRGGSDTTAVAMAAALKAQRCEIIKEVEGVCSADPRLVPEAHSYAELSYASLLEMTFWGAKVLHYRSVELAQHSDVQLVIKKWGRPTDATVIRNEVNKMEQGRILSVNSLARIEHLEIEAPTLAEASDLFSAHLQTHRLAWPQILASAFDNGRSRLMLTSDSEALSTLLRTIGATQNIRSHKPTLSSVTVTCHGAVATDLPHTILQTLMKNGINVDKYMISPLSVTVCVPPEQREAAVQTLHKLIR